MSLVWPGATSAVEIAEVDYNMAPGVAKPLQLWGAKHVGTRVRAPGTTLPGIEMLFELGEYVDTERQSHMVNLSALDLRVPCLAPPLAQHRSASLTPPQPPPRLACRRCDRRAHTVLTRPPPSPPLAPRPQRSRGWRDQYTVPWAAGEESGLKGVCADPHDVATPDPPPPSPSPSPPPPPMAKQTLKALERKQAEAQRLEQLAAAAAALERKELGNLPGVRSFLPTDDDPCAPSRAPS